MEVNVQTSAGISRRAEMLTLLMGKNVRFYSFVKMIKGVSIKVLATKVHHPNVKVHLKRATDLSMSSGIFISYVVSLFSDHFLLSLVYDFSPRRLHPSQDE